MAKAGFRPVITTDKVSTFVFTPSRNESQISSSISVRTGGGKECPLHGSLACLFKRPCWWAGHWGRVPLWSQVSLQWQETTAWQWQKPNSVLSVHETSWSLILEGDQCPGGGPAATAVFHACVTRGCHSQELHFSSSLVT